MIFEVLVKTCLPVNVFFDGFEKKHIYKRSRFRNDELTIYTSCGLSVPHFVFLIPPVAFNKVPGEVYR